VRIHNLYTDAKGESHFRDIEVEWAEERRGSKLSKRLPANGVIFRETRAESAGEVLLVEDTTGKGHLSDHVEGKIRHSIFIPIE
jgi:hypothetical protein